MTPVNNKSFIAHMYSQLERLANGDITAKDASAYASIASQINKAFDYELKRTAVQIRLYEIGQLSEATLRNIESKGFDNAVQIGDGNKRTIYGN